MISRSELDAYFGFDRQDLAGLRNYLRFERERFQGIISLSIDEMPEVHVVLGNESADLDSIVSAIARAYHLFLINDNNNIYLPYINISREELGLRRDVLYLLDNLGIPTGDLSFNDDSISLSTLHGLNKLKLHLVDHNELNPDQSHLSDAVVDIIDHHADAGQYSGLPDKIIRTIGSCTTLVVQEFIKTQPVEKMPAALACLFLAPVLIDTDNLGSKEKTTPDDRALVNALALRVGAKLPGDFYAKLRANKEDTSGFPTKWRLLKDFKKYQSGELAFGIASLVSPTGFGFENEAEIVPDFEDVLTKRALDFLLVLMPYYSEGRHPQRKIVVYTQSPEILAAFDLFVKNDAFLQGKELSLEREPTAISFYISQRFMARKEIEPSIKSISENEAFMAAFRKSKQDKADGLSDSEKKTASPLRANSLFLGSSSSCSLCTESRNRPGPLS